MLLEDSVAEVVNLALVDNLKAGALKPKIEPANPREEGGKPVLRFGFAGFSTHGFPTRQGLSR